MSLLKKCVVSMVIGLAASLTIGAGVAQAGSLTLYAEKNYRAWIGEFWSAMSSPWNMSDNANDTLSSYTNDTPYSVAFAYDRDLRGHCFTGKPGQHDPAFWWYDDNEVSSFQIGRAC